MYTVHVHVNVSRFLSSKRHKEEPITTVDNAATNTCVYKCATCRTTHHSDARGDVHRVDIIAVDERIEALLAAEAVAPLLLPHVGILCHHLVQVLDWLRAHAHASQRLSCGVKQQVMRSRHHTMTHLLIQTMIDFNAR